MLRLFHFQIKLQVAHIICRGSVLTTPIAKEIHRCSVCGFQVALEISRNCPLLTSGGSFEYFKGSMCGPCGIQDPTLAKKISLFPFFIKPQMMFLCLLRQFESCRGSRGSRSASEELRTPSGGEGLPSPLEEPGQHLGFDGTCR